MAKKEKNQEFRFYTINVKLRNARSKEDVDPRDYVSLFIRLFERRINKQSSATKHCIIKSLTPHSNDKGEILFLSGILIQFTFIEGKSWINLRNLDEDEFINIPEDTFPDPVQTEFIFVPSAHRFGYRVQSTANLAPKPVAKFLEAALNQVATSDEIVQVDVETEKTPLTMIENAKSLQKLRIKINYSNFDIGNDVKQFVEDQNRRSNLKDLEIIATPKKGSSIDLTDSVILKGALENTTSNGVAEATIINEDNKRVKINTTDFPMLLRVRGTLSRFPELVYNKIMGFFRSEDGKE